MMQSLKDYSVKLELFYFLLFQEVFRPYFWIISIVRSLLFVPWPFNVVLFLFVNVTSLVIDFCFLLLDLICLPFGFVLSDKLRVWRSVIIFKYHIIKYKIIIWLKVYRLYIILVITVIILQICFYNVIPSVQESD